MKVTFVFYMFCFLDKDPEDYQVSKVVTFKDIFKNYVN